MARKDIMAEPGGKPLGVGVIGLGRRWRTRYQPALQALAGRFQVAALCDQVAEQAHREAGRLGCAEVAGPTELLERPDVDAVLLLDPQWYGLWPLEAACRLRKPVFCCDLLARDDGHADRLHQLVQESGVPVMVGISAAICPALARVRELLATRLGAPRLLLGSVLASGRRLAEGADQGPDARLLPAFTPLLSWCAALLAGEPRRVLAAGVEGGLASLLLDFGVGRGAQLTQLTGGAAGPRTWQVQLTAEHGSAIAEAGQVRCCGPDGHLTYTLTRPRPTTHVLLEAFGQALHEGRPPQPGLAEAYRLLRWRRLALQSWALGRWVCPSS
jgi:predicted dehydrogenase